MSKFAYGIRVAQISMNYVNKDVRAGFIVFGNKATLSKSDEVNLSLSGKGFTFYLKARENDYGVTYGGFVSSPKLNKDDEYGTASYWMDANPYKKDGSSIVYLVNLTEVYMDDAAGEREFGEKRFGGALYASDSVKGLSQGTLSILISDDNDDDDDEPVRKKSSNSGSRKPQQSSKPSYSSTSDRTSPKVKSTSGSKSSSKRSNDDDDDVPFY